MKEKDFEKEIKKILIRLYGLKYELESLIIELEEKNNV